MMGWLIALGIIGLLAMFPLGIRAGYQQEGLLAWVLVGPVKIRLYPSKKKQDKAEEPEQMEKPEQTEEKQPPLSKKEAAVPKMEPIPSEKPDAPVKTQVKPSAAVEQPQQQEFGGSWKDFLPMLDVLWDFLGDLRRKIRVRYLKLDVTLAGEDPCDLAVNYGRMNAAVAGLLAQMNHLFVIVRQDVQLHCDFAAEQTVVVARLDVTITVARVLGLLARYGWRAFKTYSSTKKQREGGAKL